MFPISTTLGPGILARQTDFGDREAPFPNRLDCQRRFLEYQENAIIDLILLTQRYHAVHPPERQRQIMVAEASKSSRVSIARSPPYLRPHADSAGERIRPDDVVTERTANA